MVKEYLDRYRKSCYRKATGKPRQMTVPHFVANCYPDCSDNVIAVLPRGFRLPSSQGTAITPPQELLEVAKAKVSRVFCSSSWALAEPVAGLALAERFTERTRMFRACAMCSSRGST